MMSRLLRRGVMAVVGCFLIHFTFGTLYTFGNMNPYITSYLLNHTSSNNSVTYSQTTWILSLTFFGQGSVMAIGGVLEKRIGTRLTTLIGSLIMSAGVLLTYFSIQVHLIATMFTYGFMFGVGTGIAYAVAIGSSMSWFPRNKGLVGGVVVAGFGSGALVFNLVQTFFINPEGLAPEITNDGEKYFGDVALLKRVPQCFLLIGGIYVLLQSIGVLLISKSPPDDEQQRLVASPEGKNITEANYQQDSEYRSYDVNLKPHQMLMERDFWVLWFAMLFNVTNVIIISSLYKVFGQKNIQDDYFLAVVGSVSSIFNSGGRIIWGQLHDKLHFKPLMLVLTASLAFLLCTIIPVTLPSKYFYGIWVCLMFCVFSGNFVLFPAVLTKEFGHKYFATNYGILFTANSLSSIVGAVLSSIILSQTDNNMSTWWYIFGVGAGLSGLAFLVTLLHRGYLAGVYEPSSSSHCN